ncbi:hypothetical protein M409DRAFT_28278 [Zasmidium cellare ATCC 36951]|uniref:Mid2 domain-containing protein n=1 Tax=Zasmidium cellare ATCC 36951 TaxID=1080233 RepID=A0A6A6C667_ZASCE|nr:uncharacterized protein M409DRAFT_28278 [Zasmidium cellare ATCC 36951]KAF2161239.1 hypothetical protein M409DRAFT_28278 [Zasmidium cellare ATCC 36951]
MLVKTFLRFITILRSLVWRVGADRDEKNYFINPPWEPGVPDTFDNNNFYDLGSTLDLNWETNFTTISLVLRQQDNASYTYLIERQPASKTLVWDVDLDGKYNITSTVLKMPNGEPLTSELLMCGASLSLVTVFSFEVWEIINGSGQIGRRFSSHHFNISIAAAATPSPSSDSSGNWPAMAAKDEPTTVPPAPSGLSVDAYVAVGIGVGLVAVCLAIAVAIPPSFFWKQRKEAIAAAEEEMRQKLESAPPKEGQEPTNPPIPNPPQPAAQ